MEIKQTAKQFDIKTSDIKTSDIETSEIEAFEIEAFELKALGQHFPSMPEELRSMVEQEVRKQMGTTSPIRRRNYKARKVLIATLAAVMLLGTTVAAGVTYRKGGQVCSQNKHRIDDITDKTCNRRCSHDTKRHASEYSAWGYSARGFVSARGNGKDRGRKVQLFR